MPLRRLCLIAAAIIVFAACGQAAEVEQTDEKVTVRNDAWTVTLEKRVGWVITDVRGPRGAFPLDRLHTRVFPRMQDPAGPGMVMPEARSDISQHATIQVRRNEADQSVTVRRTWRMPAGQGVEETIFDPHAPLARRTLVFESSQRLEAIEVEANMSGQVADRVVHYPEGERIPSRTLEFTAGLPYMLAYDPQLKMGFGLRPAKDMPRLSRFAWGARETEGDIRRDSNLRVCGIGLGSSQLSFIEAPKRFELAYDIFLSSGTEPPFRVDWPAVELRRVFAQKLVARPLAGNAVLLALINHTDKPRDVRYAVTLNHGLIQQRVLTEQQITLPPGQTELSVPVVTRNLRYGVEIAATLTDLTTQQTHTKKDYFTVSDNFFRVCSLDVSQPMGLPGRAERWYARRLRSGYCGLMELYTWAPDQTTDLTPPDDWYLPETESQGYGPNVNAYSGKLMADMVKGFHANGVGVVAETTQFMNSRSSLQYPEQARYIADGTVQSTFKVSHNVEARTHGVYDRDEREFATTGAVFLEAENIHRWGREFAEAVRRFGFDGVRFDSGPGNLLGLYSGDPLKIRDDTPIVFDFQGRSLNVELDLDAYALRNMTIWMSHVLNARADFNLGMNGGIGTGDLLGMFPRSYQYAGALNAYFLFEGALNVARPGWDTWDGWAKVLTDNYRINQSLGASGGVGSMRLLCPGTMRTLCYTAFASGHHLYNMWGRLHTKYGDEIAKAYRFEIRFGEYLYDASWQPLERDQTKLVVDGHERLLWRDFVRRRTLRDGQTETIVHLVNRPAGDKIVRAYDPATVREGTRVRLKLPPGAQPVAAWAIQPDPERVTPLDRRVDQQQIEVKVPPVDAFATVVIRTRGGVQ